MAHENTLLKERLLDLGSGMAIYRAHVDALREQDVNARVMAPSKFERLVENVRKEHGLESLPLCVLQANQAGTEELHIISGHHRVRAARAAGLTEIFVIAYERELSRDEIISKQIAHNALAGEDDPQVLAALYDAINDVDAKIETGLTPEDLAFDVPRVQVDELALKVQHELVFVLFLPRQYEQFQEVLKDLEPRAHVHLADYADFDEYKQLAQEVAKRHDVRNSAAIVAQMLRIVREHLDANPPSKSEKPPAEPRKRRARSGPQKADG